METPSEDFIAALQAAENSDDRSLKRTALAVLSLLKNKRPASSDGKRSR
jgi:hypothetical protein